MIHPSAIIDRKARLDSTVNVGPYCVIDADVEIGPECKLLHSVYVTGWTTIAAHCEIHPYAVLGHAPQDIKYHGERSYCRIGPRCIIRENASIHRGTIPDSETVVGAGCFLLAGAHVGHNCRLGDRVTLINNVLLAGHVTVEDGVTIGGAAAVHQFVRIGELAMVAGLAAVTMDIPPFALTDRSARVAGLNRIGLRRAEYGRDDLTALRNAYRTLYGRAGDFRQAIRELSSGPPNPAVKKLLAFMEAPTKRGIVGRSRARQGRFESTGPLEG